MNFSDIPSYDWGNIDSPWISVDMSIWDKLLKEFPTARYSSGSDIYWQGKEDLNAYIVKEGRVCVNIINSDGSLKHIYIACPGAMIGEISCILGKSHMTAATCIVATECCVIPSKALQQQFHASPPFADILLQYVARKTRMLITQNSMLSFDRAEQRIAKILLYISDMYGRQTKKGLKIDLRFTHSDIAFITNTSRVTVSNIILSFMDSGILARYGSFYTILDLARLLDIATK